ncbi:hypothetical protein [Knoellia koreensis]|uniref:Uncharacterized protein n=1 Tax=Knoellia koreensis TaxID=2730921 RepID=A0A849HDL4_9MICO|nr:hypothetical protein [Knoellia sp. DB2414S]NNM47990.1 hypothetical protein [Knoellia sp. DB2414S]
MTASPSAAPPQGGHDAEEQRLGEHGALELPDVGAIDRGEREGASLPGRADREGRSDEQSGEDEEAHAPDDRDHAVGALAGVACVAQLAGDLALRWRVRQDGPAQDGEAVRVEPLHLRPVDRVAGDDPGGAPERGGVAAERLGQSGDDEVGWEALGQCGRDPDDGHLVRRAAGGQRDRSRGGYAGCLTCRGHDHLVGVVTPTTAGELGLGPEVDLPRVEDESVDANPPVSLEHSHLDVLAGDHGLANEGAEGLGVGGTVLTGREPGNLRGRTLLAISQHAHGIGELGHLPDVRSGEQGLARSHLEHHSVTRVRLARGAQGGAAGDEGDGDRDHEEHQHRSALVAA